MYYFVPKAAERPVYSYRLSIVHFWSLVFMYIWAGPHHLLGTSLPEWAQSLGMVFSLMLWAPSWGGMINGLLTLRGAWGKLRTDPVLKFFAAGVTFYGMATLEGPLLSIKSVSALAHYTDWIVGHAHGGALGWNGLMAAGMFYWLVPRLYGRKQLHSVRAADLHFWVSTVGILTYLVAMWVSGVTQGLMWRATNPDGSLAYPDFVETVKAIHPLYIVRMTGGLMYLSGFVIMAWNLVKTALAGKAVNGEVEVVVAEKAKPAIGWVALVTGRPMVLTALGLIGAMALGFTGVVTSLVVLAGLLVLGCVAYVVSGPSDPNAPKWHALLEGRPLLFTVLTLFAILIGGVAELLPTIAVSKAVPSTGAPQQPYSALELEGRDLYVREGCYNCHSQNIRSYYWETQRYGAVSRAEEFIYDHPFQWGSKRTGPDLSREGGKYPHLWHFSHLIDPRAVSPGSNMPSFKWLATNTVDTHATTKKLSLMQRIGVPYTNQDIDNAEANLRAQGEGIVKELATQGIETRWNSEIVALIAYLQRLGRGPQMPKEGANVPVAVRQ
jgi:cytochrome c oxidase cbb3-type subunit I/II